MSGQAIPSRLSLTIALWRMRLRLALRGARRLRLPLRHRQSPCSVAEARELALGIEQAALLVPGSRCLDRSLLLQQLVGAAATLRIGVRRSEGRVSAHAWIEVDGTVINDDPAMVAGFVPLEGVASAAHVLPYD